MRRRDLSLTIALCVSLLMHGVGMFALLRQEVARLVSSLHQPPIDPSTVAVATSRPRLPAPPPPPAPAEDQSLPRLPEFEELFGERGSNGEASNSSKGDVAMQAREAPEE